MRGETGCPLDVRSAVCPQGAEKKNRRQAKAMVKEKRRAEWPAGLTASLCLPKNKKHLPLACATVRILTEINDEATIGGGKHACPALRAQEFVSGDLFRDNGLPRVLNMKDMVPQKGRGHLGLLHRVRPRRLPAGVAVGRQAEQAKGACKVRSGWPLIRNLQNRHAHNGRRSSRMKG
ncbi:hypothetical protein [Allorhizobium borbori]|uniref:Uncharacterized protein n=1 Tax=Allorhizobium borbori TaxID=485907 RepID=A0A7W6P2S7_9HYPH|nr:hypothetical protein [Allorhizobium borbori]MBB4104151.1 hypothetical protein [Allorhizobium borbori]